MNSHRVFDRRLGVAEFSADIGSPLPPAPWQNDPEWQQPSRYTDQPMSLSTRLFGIGGVALVALLIVAAALFSWRTYVARPATPTLSVFDVAPPAAPPEPVSEAPPGPEKVQKDEAQPKSETSKIEPPKIQLSTSNPLPSVSAKSAPDPGPPIERTTAPQAKELPPAPHDSNARTTWQGLVLSALNKVKRYPRDAQARRQQGVPYIRFVIDRRGQVLSATLERSSGQAALDREAVALPRRAQPFPAPPEDVQGDTIELVVPIEFFLR